MINVDYLYDARSNAFYPMIMKDEYIAAGSWPEEGKSVTQAVYEEFTGIPPEGKMRVSDESGGPAWGDVPPPTKDNLISSAEAEKQSRLCHAKDKISLWQTELQLGIISDPDKQDLVKWVEYIKLLQAIDPATTLDFKWPDLPA